MGCLESVAVDKVEKEAFGCDAESEGLEPTGFSRMGNVEGTACDRVSHQSLSQDLFFQCVSPSQGERLN